jgi:hypothetical protein
MRTHDKHGRKLWQGLVCGLALALLSGAPLRAGAGGDATDETRGNGGGSGGSGVGFAGGDETVGTLPSTNSGDDGPGAHAPWGAFQTLGGTLRLEGDATALWATVRSLRGRPRLDIETLPGGRQRWTIAGDFELALDLGLLAGSELAVSVAAEVDSVGEVRLDGRVIGGLALDAGEPLGLPLVPLTQDGHVPSGLAVTTVDAFGTATRLSVRATRERLVISQRTRAL